MIFYGLQVTQMICKDRRIKLMNELLSGIKVCFVCVLSVDAGIYLSCIHVFVTVNEIIPLETTLCICYLDDGYRSN